MLDPSIVRHLTAIADQFEADLETIINDVDDAIMRAIPQLGSDSSIRSELRASTMANLRRMLTAQRSHLIGTPVATPPEATEIARTAVRRGIGSDAVHVAYRLGGQEAWRHWVHAAGSIVRPANELPLVLEVSLDALFQYLDQVIAAVLSAMEKEREAVRSGVLAARVETVRLLLDGAPLDPRVASRRLDHNLEQHHTALVIWNSQPGSERGRLEQAAGSIARAVGARRALTMLASDEMVWAWLGTPSRLPHTAMVELPSAVPPGVSVAVGPTRPGADGFRRSHEAALSIHRLLAAHPEAGPLLTYHDVEACALALQDDQRARDFVDDTLGQLSGADPDSVRLRESLRVFLDEAENAPRAAVRLHTHRNTVLKRVARAEERLGYRARQRRLAVQLALELQRWLD